MSLTFKTLLIIIAVVIFIIAAIGIDTGDLSLIALGLAFFAAAFVVPDRALDRR
jgi:hypothetical protein